MGLCAGKHLFQGVKRMKWTDSQASAIKHTGNNLLVSAAAGSGKTAVMIEKIFGLICSRRTSVDRILVLTFTNAAASSMREKLLKKLEEAIEEEPTNEYLANQKRLLATGNICTIHSYCIKILRQYYFNTPLPPDFKILDSAREKLISNAVMGNVIEQASKLYQSGGFPEYESFVEYFTMGKSDIGIELAIKKVFSFLSVLPDKDAFIKKALSLYDDPSVWESSILGQYKKLLTATGEYFDMLADRYIQYPFGKKAADHCAVLKAACTSALAASSLKDLQSAVLSADLGRFTKDGSAECDEFIRCRDFAKGVYNDIKKALKTLPVFEPGDKTVALVLFRLYHDYRAQLNEAIIENGGITYSGLLEYTLELFDTHEEILNELRSGTDYIFVDEYQDVNLLLDSIVSRLSHNGKNMFFVGDVKQSIYGFQLSRPQLFTEKLHAYSDISHSQDAIGEKVFLQNNFRSSQGVIDGINFIFKNLMTERISEVEYDKNAALYPSPDKASIQYKDCICDIGAPCELLLSLSEEVDSSADAIAKRIQELLKGSILDSASGQMRPVKYSDIMILGMKNSYGDEIADAMKRAEIPYSSFTGKKKSAGTCADVMLSLLSLFSGQKDDVDLISVLVSPIGGFTFTELGKIRADQPSCSLFEAIENYNGDEAICIKIKSFTTSFNKWSLLVRSMVLDEFIEYVYNDTGYIYHAALLGDAELKAMNAFIDHARRYVSFSDSGLNGFIKYCKAYPSCASDSFFIDPDDNSVHYMTIHKSKGLEFPIIILYKAEKPLLSNSPNAERIPKHNKVLLDDVLGIGFSSAHKSQTGRKSFENALAAYAITAADDSKQRAERLRLLYVALTRAKYKFIVAVHGKQSSVKKLCTFSHVLQSGCFKSFAQLIVPIVYTLSSKLDITQNSLLDFPQDFNLAQNIWNVYLTDISGTTKAQENEQKSKCVEQDYIKNVFKAISWQYPFKESTIARTKVSPSKHNLVHSKMPLRKPEFENKVYKGAQKGTIVHYFMEHVDFNSPDSARKQGQEMLLKGILTKEEFDALPFHSIDAFLNSNLGKRLKASKDVNRERSFCLIVPAPNGDEALAQGIIDCYFFENDKIVLIDYKTDIIFDSIAERAEYHKPQLLIYKNALENMYPGKTVQCYLYFFSVNAEFEII